MMMSGSSVSMMSRRPRSISSDVPSPSTHLYSIEPLSATASIAAWIAPSHGSSSGVANTPYTSSGSSALGVVVAWATGPLAIAARAMAAAATLIVRLPNLLTFDLPSLCVSVHAVCDRPC